MRTYGRITNSLGQRVWVTITTDANGDNSFIWLTTLIQCLLLNLGESPFYANYGIPARQSVQQQLPPDFFVNRTQQQFSQYFSSLIVTKQNTATPTYTINALLQSGVRLNASVPIPV